MKQSRMERTPSNGKTVQEWILLSLEPIKDRVDEDTDYEQQIAYYKKSYASIYDLEFLQQNMLVIPVPFSKHHKEMLAQSKEIMEYNNGHMAINPSKLGKLIAALRTDMENRKGMLDNEAS